MANINPVISWYKDDNSTPVTQWDFGVVDAGGGEQHPATFLIWNNRSNSVDDAKDIYNCYITTKHTDGTDGVGAGDVSINPLVTEQWVKAKLEGSAEYKKIGGTNDKLVATALGIVAPADAGKVKGTKNGGAIADSVNYVKATLCIDPPSTASAGKVDFLIRFGYSYT